MIPLFSNIALEKQLPSSLLDYTYTEIPNGERPDVVAQLLYSDPALAWTFFYINNHLREGMLQWPKSQNELSRWLDEKYDHRPALYVPNLAILDLPEDLSNLVIHNPESNIVAPIHSFDFNSGLIYLDTRFARHIETTQSEFEYSSESIAQLFWNVNEYGSFSMEILDDMWADSARLELVESGAYYLEITGTPWLFKDSPQHWEYPSILTQSDNAPPDEDWPFEDTPETPRIFVTHPADLELADFTGDGSDLAVGEYRTLVMNITGGTQFVQQGPAYIDQNGDKQVPLHTAASLIVLNSAGEFEAAFDELYADAGELGVSTIDHIMLTRQGAVYPLLDGLEKLYRVSDYRFETSGSYPRIVMERSGTIGSYGTVVKYYATQQDELDNTPDATWAESSGWDHWGVIRTLTRVGDSNETITLTPVAGDRDQIRTPLRAEFTSELPEGYVTSYSDLSLATVTSTGYWRNGKNAPYVLGSVEEPVTALSTITTYVDSSVEASKSEIRITMPERDDLISYSWSLNRVSPAWSEAVLPVMPAQICVVPTEFDPDTEETTALSKEASAEALATAITDYIANEHEYISDSDLDVFADGADVVIRSISAGSEWNYFYFTDETSYPEPPPLTDPLPEMEVPQSTFLSATRGWLTGGADAVDGDEDTMVIGDPTPLTINYVTNAEHEQTLNRQKSILRIIRPESIRRFVAAVRRMVGRGSFLS